MTRFGLDGSAASAGRTPFPTRALSSSSSSTPASENATTPSPSIRRLDFSPAASSATPSARKLRGLTSNAPSSVRLSCGSPEGDLWFSLLTKNETGNNSGYRLLCRRLVIEQGEIIKEQMKQRFQAAGHYDADDAPRVPPQPPRLLQIELPEAIQSRLRLEPPVELLCVEAEGTEYRRTRTSGGSSKLALGGHAGSLDKLIGLPRLVLYTRHSLFLLHPGFHEESSSRNDNDEEPVEDLSPAAITASAVPGNMLSWSEPLERTLWEAHLHASVRTRIIRVRPAPQRFQGHALHSPATCFAVLLVTTSTSLDYQLALFQSNGRVTMPLQFSLEDMEENRVVDFCFAQSQGLPFFSSLSALLLQAGGHVMAATPILFHGCLVPKLLVQEALEFLENKLEHGDLERSQPLWRQYRAAQQYLWDVFPQSSQPNSSQHFWTAQTNRAKPDQAANWPTQLQGPILYRATLAPEEEDDEEEEEEEPIVDPDEAQALTLAAFGKADLVGFAVGYDNGCVDMGVTSPTTLIPRFGLESRPDSFELDDNVFLCSAWVDRVDLGLTVEWNGGGPDEMSLSLVLQADPVFDSLLHVGTPTQIASLTSNAIRVTSQQVLQKGSENAEDDEKTSWSDADMIHTSAWSCLETTGTATEGARAPKVSGIFVATDSLTEDRLLVQLSNGVIHPINVAKRKSAHELERLVAEQQQATTKKNTPRTGLRAIMPDPASSSSQQVKYEDPALKQLEATRPFHETLVVQAERIHRGLAAMGKLVGSETTYDKISPEGLAVVASIQERCESQVVLPLLELGKLVKSRKVAVNSLIVNQMKQLKLIRERSQQMMATSERIKAKLASLGEVAEVLHDRSKAVLEASRTLDPNVTRAELAFFDFCQQTEARVSQWESQVNHLQRIVRSQSQTITTESFQRVQLPTDTAEDLRIISEEDERRLGSARQKLKDTELKVQALLRRAGLESPSENVPSNIPDE